ncbi:FUSC family protein [Streptomyces sp. NPDC058045]|uniref:FUSC family protein n=1 Tax=Streptomyces sp. NPDC058045 TaxID=3346311 RepID=UPI0036E6AA1D
MTWLRALKETARSGLTIERKRLEPLIALRGAAGLALVVSFSLWAFGPAVAAGSAFGAFQAAIATFQRSWRPRPELALASGTSLALSTFLGYVTASHPLLFLLLLVAWTFLAGMAWAAGPTVGLIASSNVAIMLVTVTLPTSVAGAAGHAAMMVVGGLVQAALVLLFPVRPWGAHRDALADALTAEAGYARRLCHEATAAFDPQPLMEARNAASLTERQARRRPTELSGTRGLAERIRPVLASLADPAVGAPAEGPQRERVRELLTAAGSVLDAAALAIRRGRPVELEPAAVSVLSTPDTEALLTGPARRAAKRLAVLLHDVVEAAGGTSGPSGLPIREAAPERSADSGPPDEPPVPRRPSGARRAPRPRSGVPLRRPGLLQLLPVALAAMRGELRPGSPILRHAVRVSAVAAAGYLIGTALPLGHGYWAPMAGVMVMRPDFSQTYSRAVARFAGTLVGVALATGVVRLASPGTYLAGLLAVVSACLMYLLLRTGQMAAQACIGAYVVFLLGMGGEQWTQTVPERVLLTLLGGVLAVSAYAVYPAWETPRLRARLADWLSTGGRYAAAVTAHYAAPGDRDRAEVREALLTARDARIAWREAKARATAEPVRHRGNLTPEAADAAGQALAQLGRVAMLMEAHLPDASQPPLPWAADLSQALRVSTERGARAVRERRVPDWAPVRAVLEEWEAHEATGAPAGAHLALPAETVGGPAVPEASADQGRRQADEQLVRSSARLLLARLDDFSEALGGPGQPVK